MSGPGGKKYGLHIPQKKPSGPARPLSIFDDNDEEDSKSTSPVVDVKQRQVEKMQMAALKEDPTVFEYDEAFSDDQDTKPTAKRSKGPSMPPTMQAKASNPPVEAPKYMATLIKNASERKAQSDIVRVRLLQKEAALVAEAHADKEVIVTSAYKKKLESMKEQMARDEQLRKEEERVQASTKNMSGFYRNLLTKNESFGAGRGLVDRAKPVVSSETGKRYGNTEAGKKEEVEDDDEEEFGPVRRR